MLVLCIIELKNFTQIWACDLDYLCTHWFPLSTDAFWLLLENQFQRVSFEYHGNKHVCCPGVAADQPLVTNFFRIVNIQSICPCSSNDTLTISPFKCMDDLC